jgi:hypothetical protein
MTPLKKSFWAIPVSCLIGVGFFGTVVRAEFRQGKALQPTDEITTLTVKIEIGKEGDALDEPVALDLGLGFPFWLEPVGLKADSATPFGAVPQQSTAEGAIAAGGSATFTFAVTGADGQDRLRTSPQLLDGVQVSDIARIGFAARGDSNWDLAGYEIKVNNQLLAANDAVNQKAGDVQQTAQFQIASVGLKVAPLKKEAADLQALKDASLATEQDLAKLAAVEKKIDPLAQELRRLEGQVAGRYAWFSEPEFAPEGSDDG